MSNSIWKMPDVKPDIDKQIIIKNDFDYIIYFGKCAVAPGNKWAYIDDLIAQADKAERLQKAVEVAKMSLEDCNKILSADMKDWGYLTAEIALKKIEQMIGQN